MNDSLGNPLTLRTPRSVNAINTFVDGFIACKASAADVLNYADDPNPMVQAYCATVHLFSESHDAPANAAPFVKKAVEGATGCTHREVRYISMINCWYQRDYGRLLRLHREHAQFDPRDLVALKLGQYHFFNKGDAAGMLGLAVLCRKAAADVPYFHGMLAFGFEQCHMMREAEASARTAIEMERSEPWAHHALSHVMLTEGRLTEGLDFMHSVSDTWQGLNSFMVTHNWWHVALFLIDLGRDEEALAVYDQHAWGVAKAYSQDQIGAVSLLARLELAGIDVGHRWDDVADRLVSRVEDFVLPFLTVQYLYGLARAGRAEADVLIANLEHFVQEAPHEMRIGWRSVCLPACIGLRAYARKDFATAARQLAIAIPQLVAIGGSHAQRDLFEQFYTDALIRCNTPESLAEALGRLQPNADGQPESVRLRKQVASVKAALGQPA